MRINNNERNINSVSSLFVRNVNSNKSDTWVADIALRNRNAVNRLKFMIYTGSDITCIPPQKYNKNMGKKHQVNEKTSGLVGENLDVRENFMTTLIFGNKQVNSLVYVIEGLTRPLLDRPVLEQHGVVRKVYAVQCTMYKKSYFTV